ncbi:transmembrane protein, putative (macronuclear) [Tetrahymena thermophila SB210]|uniref:Transmembrane protein, putative n=1 Tax=Tetrahymena thermophila (strain SB210) TaxID=312017 RepID=I7MF48_TETTS|nr:transmembrane protein, putative [Tetrahymena thermophila SB210]EAR98478.1 transmembrane protein, putative [Tetrahymena thermophila SB210]|eukprot:XP_001018723.1 transmembrane protein, putative [Tetrahymena thermophila SB210]
MNKIFFLIPIIALIGSTLFLIQQRPTADLENLVPVTFEQYQNCTEKIPSDYPCRQSQEFIDTYYLFQNQTYTPQAPEGCKQYIVYSRFFSQSDYEINFFQYFEMCYINEKVREIANSNECFFKNYYAPKYLLCGGFDIYAYPPYTPFSIGN